jgi:hypothetical protein
MGREIGAKKTVWNALIPLSLNILVFQNISKNINIYNQLHLQFYAGLHIKQYSPVQGVAILFV